MTQSEHRYHTYVCSECGIKDKYGQLDREIKEKQELLNGLTWHVQNAAKAVAASKDKLSRGGPVAITEHIMLVAKDGGLWLKVIDYRKGYWAEAQLGPEPAAYLVSFLWNFDDPKPQKSLPEILATLRKED